MDEGGICPSCGAANPAGQRFCSTCGSSLARPCPSCGAPNAPESRFCGSCGTPLVAKPVAAAGGGEERKVVSVLFADLVGFTARSDRADPEDVQAVLRTYHARVRREIETLGGTVEKFIGDAVVGVFGAPTAHEDDAERAVRAALRVMQAIEDLNEADPELALSARAAVNTGEAVVALDARAHEGEGFVAGDVVNTASRLQNVAPAGGVVVGELTYLATRDAVDYEPLDPVTVKGKAEPIRIWLARAARSDVERRALAPLVGRSRELDLLTALWDKVVGDRHPHLVTILGPPGIGKSRLLRELQPRFEEDGRVIKGRCRPYGETTGYGALGQQIEELASIFETDHSAAARTKLRALVEDLLGPEEGPEVEGHLSVLLGQSTAGAPDKQLLFYSARRFVEALADRRPTLLVFEDIHWAEPALLDLIESLAARVHDVPLLLVTLARPELLDVRPTWGGGLRRYTAVPLEPLGEMDGRKLALALLSRSGQAEEAIERVLHTSGGNPLFLEELSASLAEHAAGLASGLPTSVQAIIAARLDALPAEERKVLQDASVIGQVFWRGPLAAIAGDGARLDMILDSLEGRDFIRRQPTSRVPGDREFIFKHVLTREVAYGTLPRAGRRERHAVVAGYVEEAAGDRAQESASILAHHWRESGEPARAARYLVMAAEVASRAWAKEQAVALYTEGVDLLEGAGDREQLAEARLGRALTLIDAGHYERAITEDLDWLLEAATGRTLVLALLARAQAAFWLADAPGVRTYSGKAAETSRSLGDSELEGRSLALLHEVVAMDGDTQSAVGLLTEAQAKWPPERRDASYAYAISQGSVIPYWRGEYEDALRMSTEGYEAGMALSNVQAAVNGAAHAGLALAGLGRHEEGLEWLRRAVELGREREAVPRFTARSMNMWSGTLREIGNLVGARALSEEALELARRAAFPGAEISARIDLVMTDLEEGEVSRAERPIAELTEAAERTKGWHQWLWMIRLTHARAEIALAAGRAEEAAGLAEEAVRRSLGPGRVKYACLARTVWGRALLALGRASEAGQALAQAVADGERLRHAPSLWPALAAQAAALRRVGREDEAARALERARAAVESMAGSLEESRRQILLGRRDVAEIVGTAAAG